MPRAETRQTAIRLTEEDDETIDFLRRATGIQSTSELFRMVLREAASKRGWAPPPAESSDDAASSDSSAPAALETATG